ncbi:hypothetical protein GR702_20120, partial [Novosphingobium sp. FGD1]|nr:hypothetical protein [Novosphingobium silvae]
MSRIRAFTMPKWGIEMTEGTIADWMVKEGEPFKRGQTLCLIETAKITNEVEAEYDATVRRIVVGGGSEAEPVGALLAVFDEGDHSDEEIEAFVAAFKPAEGGIAKGAEKAKAAAQEDAEAAPALSSPLPKSIFRDGAQPGPADMMISSTPASAATWPTRAKISAF